jgi:hypothetical protein
MDPSIDGAPVPSEMTYTEERCARDNRLIRTDECDDNEGEVRFSWSDLRVPRDDEDLDLGTIVSVSVTSSRAEINQADLNR